MKNIFLIVVFFMLFATMFSKAQTQDQIEEINNTLDRVPYFQLALNYSTKYVLPDSTQTKIIKALKKELPKHFTDSVFSLSDEVLNNIEKYAWQQCNNDTNCYKKIYEERCRMNINSEERRYSQKCLSRDLVLACGSWKIADAIPYLDMELRKEHCTQFGEKVMIEMALAKLNVDSVKQVLIKRYTLSSLLSTQMLYSGYMPLDTINDNNFDVSGQTIELLQEGIQVAIYLEENEILLNLLDLMYVRGKYNSNIDISTIIPYVVIYFSNYFYNHPNYNKLKNICFNYAFAVWHLENKKLNNKEKQELAKLLSTEYRTKIRNQIQDWIIENVDFEK
jgi:hypothetical protein